jgi:imidazolonepropionase-like amidohydrolase
MTCRRRQTAHISLLTAPLLAILLAGFTASAQSNTIIIEHVTLIDGTGQQPLSDRSVVVKNGRFDEIVPSSALAAGIEGQRIDGRGKYLIPGLVDMHVHLKGGMRDTPEGGREPANDREQALRALHSYLYSGVTSIYDAGNNPDFILSLRKDERAGRIVSPRIFATGAIVTAPGSHGSYFGDSTVDSWPEAQPTLDAHIAREPDVLKLTLEERGWGARPLIPLLDLDLMQRIIEYYNNQGIRTTAHTSSERRARQAIFAGIDTLAHPVIQGPISEDFARLMGAKKIPMTTTLTIGENYSRLVDHPEYLDQPLYLQALTEAERNQLRGETRDEWSQRVWTQWMKLMTPVAQENLRQIHTHGGVLVLGTDQSIGPAAHREMELLQDAGIPAHDIIRIATLNGAIFLGKEDEMGSIEPGKVADAVLLNKDPSEDVNHLKAIAMVMKNGKIIDRDAL